MFYPRLAVTNIGKNRKSYIPYLVTCFITIMLFYVMDAICKNEGVLQMPGADAMVAILNMASWITGIFSAIFLFYTNSFLIKQRKKEFGLYQVLGMDKRNLAKMILWESAILFLASLCLGLLGGILFGKLMFLILLKIIRFSVPLAFSIEGQSVVRTLCLFAGVFAINCIFNLYQMGKANPVELLHGGSTGEREPKAKWFLALIGAAALGAGYYLALSVEQPLAAIGAFFIAVILVIVGTYALFTAGSIALLKLLKKNKNFYYHPKHFTSVSGMIYRMKQNAAGLSNICIMSTVVLVLISVTVSLYAGMEDVLKSRFPAEYHISLSNPDVEREEEIRQIVEEELKRAGVQAKQTEAVSAGLAGIWDGKRLYLEDAEPTDGNYCGVNITALDCYNALEGKQETLEEGEVLFYIPGETYEKEEVVIGEETFRIKKPLTSMYLEKYETESILNTVYIVMPDMDALKELVERYAYGGDGAGSIYYDMYLDPAEDGEDLTEALQAITDRCYEIDGTYMEWRESSRESFYQLYGGFLFIGIFVGLLFLMGTVLIIYYKQISEGYDDRKRFQILKKVGMSRKEIKSAIRSQVLTVFFLPLCGAVVHIVVAFRVLTKLMAALNLTNVRLEAFCTAGTVLVFAVFYVFVFLITSREYYRIVQ